MSSRSRLSRILSAAAFYLLAACSATPDAPLIATAEVPDEPAYVIGPGDQVQVFVWRNPDLTATINVRPDGRISVPLIEDLLVAGKAPSTVAREIETKLADYVREPKVTVIVNGFVGPADRQIRVVGEAAKPQAIPFRKDMTVLDVLIAAGGLTEFAAGNQALIVRRVAGKQTTFRVRLADLIKGGDMSANAQVAPGDVLLIPQSWF
jgi:polysaccharide export outer membrane protein